MLLVIDIGNTRTKWALADDHGQLSPMQNCLNGDISKANFPVAQAKKVLISNVAGQQMARQITQLLTPLALQFIMPQGQARGIINDYEPTLGTDRWAALVAAWQLNAHATIVVNAGTAITIDAIARNTKQQGYYHGGMIMPGLRLMHESLVSNTAQLKVGEGVSKDFPQNTSDAIETGCLNAVIGAIVLMAKRLEIKTGLTPALILTGGDAHKIEHSLKHAFNAGLNSALNIDAKQVIMAENLVLQGLVLLAKG